MERSIKVVIVILLILTFGCAPPKFIPKEFPEIKFEETPKYELDLDSIKKPNKIVPIFVDENFQKVDKENAKFIVLVPSEYAKVAGLLKLAKAYKQVALEQEVLVNNQVDIINSLKEYVELERAKVKAYRQLWADSENAYRQEKYQHKLDNAMNKVILGTIVLGVMIAAIIAL